MALGALLWAGHERPDILIADSGRLFGIRTEAGRVLSSDKGNGFAAESWLQDDGDLATQAEAMRAARWCGGATGSRPRCRGSGRCVYVGARDTASAAADCAAAAILIAPNWEAGPRGPLPLRRARPAAPRRGAGDPGDAGRAEGGGRAGGEPEPPLDARSARRRCAWRAGGWERGPAGSAGLGG